MEPERGLEMSLWRAALAISGETPRADRGLEAVVRAFARPEGVGESRLFATLVSAATPEAMDSDAVAARAAAILNRVSGVESGIVAAALGRDRGWVEALPAPPGAPELRAMVDRADADAAIRRVDEATAGVRRRRRRLSAIKLTIFFICVGLLTYVLFDLRAAADREHARRTPADLLSVPLTPEDKRPPPPVAPAPAPGTSRGEAADSP